MLDFFFRHYEPFVSHFYLFDDGSDDGTLEYLAQKPNVTVQPFSRGSSQSFLLSALDVFEHAWQQNSAASDWVAIVDIDEHLYHPDIMAYLQEQYAAGVTVVPALGFQMLTDDFPAKDALLCRDHCIGAAWKQMSKLALFRPDAVQATQFRLGRHGADPLGDIRYPAQDEVLLLHYKYLGLEAIARRHAAAQARRRALDLARNWGHRYAFDAAQLGADFADFESRAVDYRSLTDPHRQHSEPRWWR